MKSSWLILLGLLVACGRAPEAEAPRAEPAGAAAPTSLQTQGEREPETLAEAEQLLEQARADLNRLALAEPEAAPGSAAASAGAPARAAAAPAPAPEPPREQKRAEKSAADEAPTTSKEEGSCETACRAFSSLERASAAVCRLDSPNGQRCARARQIREDASRRVASCACSK
jgi:hypothetical protein